MPRTTKEDKKIDEKSEEKKVTRKTKTASSTKSKVAKNTKSTTKKVIKDSDAKNTTKKVASITDKLKKATKEPTGSVTKKSTTKKASTSKKSTVTKKETTKSNKSAKKAVVKKTSAKKTVSTKVKKLPSNVVAEYYDLPYRYNETVVKILYQTPTILFVYWDISDEDKTNYIKVYGEHFFYNTKPVLKIYNLTKDYSFEIEINDFANSWYINNIEPECKYKVELTRKVIKFEENLSTINNDYIYVSSSNDMTFPNDHILLDELPNVLKFRNVKTNATFSRNISTLHLIGINKIYNVHDFYKRFYKDEIFEDLGSNRITICSSSSSSPSSWK